MEHYATNIFSIPFASASIGSSTGPWDLVAVQCSTNARTVLKEIDLGQKSTNVPALNQQLDVQIIDGITGSSLNGSALTLQNTKRWAGATTAGGSAHGPGVGLITTSSLSSLMVAKPTDYSGDMFYRPEDHEEFVFDAGAQFVVRIDQPGLALLVSGTIIVQERQLKG